MKTYTLQGNSREVLGRKVKNLRRSGQTPATVYGKKVESTSVSVSADEFARVYEGAGETGVVELKLGSGTKPVLIHNVQRDPVDGSILHVEFYQVDLNEKVTTNVPLNVVGESPAVAEHKGVILKLVSEVEVEALPRELPEKIDVDISALTDVDQEITVSQLTVLSGVTIKTDGTVAIVKVGALVSKEAEAQAATEAQEAAEAAATETPESGEEAAADKKPEPAAESAETPEKSSK